MQIDQAPKPLEAKMLASYHIEVDSIIESSLKDGDTAHLINNAGITGNTAPVLAVIVAIGRDARA